jgi:hypothetical protein
MACQPSASVREASFEHAMGARRGDGLAIRRKDSLLRALEDSTPNSQCENLGHVSPEAAARLSQPIQPATRFPLWSESDLIVVGSKMGHEETFHCVPHT